MPTKNDSVVAQFLEDLLRQLRAGELTVTKFSIVDDERLALAMEFGGGEKPAAPTRLTERPPAAASRPPSGPACPQCGATTLADAGGGDAVCLSCQANFSP